MLTDQFHERQGLWRADGIVTTSKNSNRESYQVQVDISMISTRSGLLDQSITNSMAVLKRLLYLQRSKFYLLRMHHAEEVLHPHLSLPYLPLPQGVSATPPFLPHYSLKLFYSQPKK